MNPQAGAWERENFQLAPLIPCEFSEHRKKIDVKQTGWLF
jgi:hypothetical protein